MSKFSLTSSGQGRWASDTATPAQVTASVTSVTLAAANPNRMHLCIDNNSTSVLYVLWGSGTASPSNYSLRMQPNAFYESPSGSNPWVGAVTGVWVSANGFAAVTDAS